MAEPAAPGAVRQQIETRTFGHLFRDCAVTELVDCAPEEIDIPPTCSAIPPPDD